MRIEIRRETHSRYLCLLTVAYVVSFTLLILQPVYHHLGLGFLAQGGASVDNADMDSISNYSGGTGAPKLGGVFAFSLLIAPIICMWWDAVQDWKRSGKTVKSKSRSS